MPNQLFVSPKKAYPLAIRDAVVKHIADKHPETHPDAFREDINRWEELRAAAVDKRVHIETSTAMLKCVVLSISDRPF